MHAGLSPHHDKEQAMISAHGFRSFLPAVLVVAAAILCQQIVVNSLTHQANKYDYAELNHAVYGFLSVDEWKDKLTPIVEAEINKLYLPKSKRRLLKRHVEKLLNTLIDKIYARIEQAPADTIKDKAAKIFVKNFVDVSEIKKGVPEYADAILKEMAKPESQRQIKTVLNEQLRRYASRTFDTQDRFLVERILFDTDTETVHAARTKLAHEMKIRGDLIVKQTILLIALAVAVFVLAAFGPATLSPTHYALLVASLVILLIAGVTTPMIDMHATIPHLSLEVLGQKIHFDNQELYFQSKSILDVFWVMITHEAFQTKFVAVLLVTFSVIFPTLKILASFAYHHNYRNARASRVIDFFVFKAGKWSMADVMVVAIFMAYVGFNGVIATGFHDLQVASQEKQLMLFTTNATALQPGFYLFLSYTLLSLFLSEYLARRSAPPR